MKKESKAYERGVHGGPLVHQLTFRVPQWVADALLEEADDGQRASTVARDLICNHYTRKGKKPKKTR